MASIGDLFFRLLADDKGFKADVERKAAVAGTAGGAALGKNLGAGALAQLRSALSPKTILAGLGVGVGISAVGLVTSGIRAFVDVLGDAVHAAMEEEASIAQLGTSLRANVPDWAGNTAAIESLLRARMKLGFSDEEQRQSLSLLLAATHDVAKAEEIQATAMDLARFKRISLADATEALTRVEAGSYRILKSLGIVLKDGATQTDALAAVQRVAAGQAADFAGTNEGKLAVSQLKVNEALEKFGKGIAPVAAGALGLLADAATVAGDAYTAAAAAVDDFSASVAETEKKAHLRDQGAKGSVLDVIGDLWGKAARDAAAAALQWEGASARATHADLMWRDSLRKTGTALIDEAAARRAAVNASNATLGARLREAAATAAAAAALEAERRALDASSAALDRQAAKLTKRAAAEETVFARTLRNLAASVAAQLASMDADRNAAQAARDLADAQQSLATAQGQLRADQLTGKDTGADVAAIAQANQRLVDLKAAQTTDARRAELEATQKYVEDVASIEAGSEDKRSLAHTFAAREKVLTAQLAADKEKGDTQAVADDEIKLQAVRTAKARAESGARIVVAQSEIAVKKAAIAAEIAALGKVPPAVDEITRATHGEMLAIEGVSGSLTGKGGLIEAEKTTGLEAKAAGKLIRDAFLGLPGVIGSAADALGPAFAALWALLMHTPPVIDFKMGGKAAGGPVPAGAPVLVGERGPEWWVPDRAGTILPNASLTAPRIPSLMVPALASSSTTAGGGTLIIESLEIDIGGNRVIDQIDRALLYRRR